MSTEKQSTSLQVTVEEIGALREIVENCYANASEEDDDNDRELRDLLTNLLEKLERHFAV